MHLSDLMSASIQKRTALVVWIELYQAGSLMTQLKTLRIVGEYSAIEQLIRQLQSDILRQLDFRYANDSMSEGVVDEPAISMDFRPRYIHVEIGPMIWLDSSTAQQGAGSKCPSCCDESCVFRILSCG